MPQSLSKVYVHIVFSTKHRARIITEDIEEELFSYIAGICKNLECNPVIVGGYLDHIHILCQLSRKISQMELVGKVKANSSRWIKTVSSKHMEFKWQDGYGIFSVNPSGIETVKNYINNQKQHHLKPTFKDEYLKLLNEHEIEFDEKYLWD
jgi:putative transposase